MTLLDILYKELLTISGIFSQTFKLYVLRWRVWLGIVAVLGVPLVVAEALLIYTLGGPAIEQMSSLAFPQTAANLEEIGQALDTLPLDAGLAYLKMMLILSILEPLVFQNIVSSALINATIRQSGVIDGYRMPLWCYLAVIVTLLLTFALAFLPGLLLIIIALGVLILDVPGAFGIAVALLLLDLVVTFLACMLFFFRLYFAPQIVVVERVGPLRALARSWRLVGSWQRYRQVLILSVPLALLAFVVGLISPDLQRDGLVRLGLSATSGYTIAFIISHITATIMVFSIWHPIATIAITLLYQEFMGEERVSPQPGARDAFMQSA